MCDIVSIKRYGENMPDMRNFWRKFDKLGRYGGYGGLRTWILYTLNDSPKNGAEIMDAIESMSYGSWRPSPGSIYPLLVKMVEEGLVRKREDGRYEAADTTYDEFGRGMDRSYTAEGALKEIDSYISYLEDLPLEKIKPFVDGLGHVQERLEKLRKKLI
jgi:DNA-binding PadR family transcriptional regulator